MVATADAGTTPTRSLKGLLGLNFLMADVRDGLGPYLSVYLKANQHWQAADIGIAMAASSVAAAVAQILAGYVVDRSESKRLLVALAAIATAAGRLLIVFFPALPSVIASQIVIGISGAIIPPTISSMTLGLVGRRKFDHQISRNESANHGGNFAAAALAGLLGTYFGYDWIFYLLCCFAILSVWTLTLIDPRAIDHDVARGGDGVAVDGDGDRPTKNAVGWRDLLKKRDLVVFLISVILFHFGNAAMLPMAGQVLAQTHPGTETIALSVCIIAAQLVMVGVAWAVGKTLEKGMTHKRLFMIAYAVLPIRGVLFSLTDSPYAIVAIQLLDGVAAGIFGVVSILIVSDLMRGTGRFNLALGLVGVSIGIGAGLSNLISGFVVQAFGYSVAFLALAALSIAALCLFTVMMPERAEQGTGTAFDEPNKAAA